MTPAPSAMPTPTSATAMYSDRKPAAIRSHSRPKDAHEGTRMNATYATSATKPAAPSTICVAVSSLNLSMVGCRRRLCPAGRLLVPSLPDVVDDQRDDRADRVDGRRERPARDHIRVVVDAEVDARRAD